MTARARTGLLSSLALAALLGLQATLAVLSSCRNSATVDEVVHLPAGYTYLVTGDHRLNAEHPPLVKLLAAAPLLAFRPVFPREDASWLTVRQWLFGRRFLFRWNDGGRLLFWGRLPVIALSLVLTSLVFLRARRLFGPAAGALSGLLCALYPDVLAHGGLVTTDLAFALFFFASVVAFERLVERPTVGRVIVAGLAVGAALASKFSAPILGLVLPALLVVGAWGRSRREIARLVLALAGAGALSLLLLWGTYGFRTTFTSDRALRAGGLAVFRDERLGVKARVADTLAEWQLLPEDYLRGLLSVVLSAEGRTNFLLGEVKFGRFPHYYLVTFLLKTPLPLLILLVLAAVWGPRLSGRAAVFLWLPVAAYAALALAWGPQIGHRHLLPLYPFLFVSAGRAAVSQRAPRRILTGLLASWYAFGTLAVHPQYLAYFNELAGGQGRAWKLLVDSNLDWGQDLPALKEWMDEHGVARIKFSYFGGADPAYYGVRCDFLPSHEVPPATPIVREVHPGDLVAVSVTTLQGLFLSPDDGTLMARLRGLEPVGRAGWSIRIYRADFHWRPPD